MAGEQNLQEFKIKKLLNLYTGLLILCYMSSAG
jgi:hypothetical protein